MPLAVWVTLAQYNLVLRRKSGTKWSILAMSLSINIRLYQTYRHLILWCGWNLHHTTLSCDVSLEPSEACLRLLFVVNKKWAKWYMPTISRRQKSKYGSCNTIWALLKTQLMTILAFIGIGNEMDHENGILYLTAYSLCSLTHVFKSF